MKIDELEKYLEKLLETDFQVRASQEKVIILNNMLAACRSLLSLENICNSETLNDGYKVFMTSNMNNFSSSFVMAALQRLAELNIAGNGASNFSYSNMNLYQSTPITPITPVVPVAPMPQPQYVPMPQQPMSPPPVYQQPEMPQMPPQPQSFEAPPQPPQPAPQPAPQAPEAPQPAAAAPQPAPQPAPSAPAEEEAGEESSLDEKFTPESSSSSKPNISFDVGLPGIGGGKNDGPTEGRDYLLSLLSKK
jgi:hypothetical protein